MDSNLFEYLIIIFFIVSALQSLFGKKKKEKQQRERRERQASGQAGGREQQSQRREESGKDVLEELFGLKFPEDDTKQTKIPSDKETEILDPAEAMKIIRKRNLHTKKRWRNSNEKQSGQNILLVNYRTKLKLLKLAELRKNQRNLQQR